MHILYLAELIMEPLQQVLGIIVQQRLMMLIKTMSLY